MKTPRIVKSVGHIDDDLINDAVKSEKLSKKNTWIKWTSLAACFAVVLIVAAVAGPMMSGSRNIAPSVDEENVNPAVKNSAANTSSDIEESFSQNHTEEIDSSVNNEGTDTPVSDNVTDSPSNKEETKPTVNNETTQPVTNQSVFEEAYFYRVSDGVFSTYISGKVIAEEKLGSKIDDVSVSAGWKNSFDEWLTSETLRAEVYLINGVPKDVAVALKFIDKGDALTTTHYYVIMNSNADLTLVKDYIIAPVKPGNIGEEVADETVDNELAEEYVVGYTGQAVNE